MILQILFAHCLGDYFLQTDYLAMNKGKDNYILLIHSVLYTFAIWFIFGGMIPLVGYWFILLTHIAIDYLKARGITVNKYGDKKALILDQITHYVILIVVLLV